MEKRNLAKLLLLTVAAFCTNTAFGVEAELLLGTEAPLTVSIEKSASSIESATIDAVDGVNKGTALQSVFTLQTNGTDDDYDIIMTSSVPISGGTTSGYAYLGGQPVMMFTNSTNLATESDISNLRSGGTSNCNVIAYPITVNTPSPMTSQYYADYSTYGECIVIKLNGGTSGNIKQTVGATPAVNTYRVGQDTAGTYRATVTISAYSKL